MSFTKNAIELSKRFDKRFLELARALRQLKRAAPDRYRLCVKNSGISQRKAYYLLSVCEAFETLQVPEERLKAIGWTKLQVIAGHVTKHNVNELLKLAETETTRDLKALMSGAPSKTTPHCVLMYFTEAQYGEFAEAVLSHGAAKVPRGLIGKEEALAAVIQSYKELLAHFVENFGTEAKDAQLAG
jgi:hypothetical protein